MDKLSKNLSITLILKKKLKIFKIYIQFFVILNVY